MLKTVLAAVLAATALVPAAALAQDGHWQGRNGNGGNRGGGGGGQWHGNPGGGGQWNGGNRQFQPRQEAQPQAQPQAQQQAQQPQPQFRRDGGNWQNRGGDHRPAGNWQGRNGDGVRPYQAQQPRQFQPQGNPNFRRGPESYSGYDRNGYNRGGGYDGYNRGGYNGGNRGYQGGYANRGNWNRDWRRDGRYDYGGYRAQNRYAYHLPRYYAPGGWGYGYRRFGIGFALNEILFSQDYWIDDPYNYRLPEAYGPYRWVRYYNDALLVDIDSGQVVDAVYGIFW